MTKLCGWKSMLAFSVVVAVTTIAVQAQTYTVLANFDGTNGADGQLGALVQGIDGDFYGVSSYGGNKACGGRGCGTVYNHDVCSRCS